MGDRCARRHRSRSTIQPHSRKGSDPPPRSQVIPAQAGIHKGSEPPPHSQVIPAEAGIHKGSEPPPHSQVIPAQAGIQKAPSHRLTPKSFPRRWESTKAPNHRLTPKSFPRRRECMVLSPLRAEPGKRVWGRAAAFRFGPGRGRQNSFAGLVLFSRRCCRRNGRASGGRRRENKRCPAQSDSCRPRPGPNRNARTGAWSGDGLKMGAIGNG